MGLTSFFTEDRGSASVSLKEETSESLCLAYRLLCVYCHALKQWHAYGEMQCAVQLWLLPVVASI